MKPKTPRILFLSHSASRNGASILLLHFLQWLQRRGELDVEVLFTGTGALLLEFQSVARTLIWRRLAERLSAVTRREHSLLRKIDLLRLRTLLRGRRFDVVYANTAATWPLVQALEGQYRCLVWHIHELLYALNVSIGADRGRQMFSQAARIISVSESVSQTLRDEFQVPAERIDMVHGFVPAATPAREECARTRESILSRLGWPDDSFVIGGCGTLGWRKGTDLFLRLAQRMVTGSPARKFRFLWVGGGEGDDESLRYAYEVKAFGLEPYCRRISTTADVNSFYGVMDVFALTSREDPFPLVMLEAGLNGVPIVCFAGSGGGPEYAATGTGLIAPYADTADFARHVLTLEANDGLRRKLGNAASQWVLDCHTVDHQSPKLMYVISKCLESLKNRI